MSFSDYDDSGFDSGFDDLDLDDKDAGLDDDEIGLSDDDLETEDPEDSFH